VSSDPKRNLHSARFWPYADKLNGALQACIYDRKLFLHSFRVPGFPCHPSPRFSFPIFLLSRDPGGKTAARHERKWSNEGIHLSQSEDSVSDNDAPEDDLHAISACPERTRSKIVNILAAIASEGRSVI